METAEPPYPIWTVDNFGVKYIGKEHADNLLQVLLEHYKVTTDWSGARYIDIHLHWDYDHYKVNLSMPSYVKKASNTQPQNQPSPHTPINCDAKKQHAKAPSDAPRLDKKVKVSFNMCVENFSSLVML